MLPSSQSRAGLGPTLHQLATRNTSRLPVFFLALFALVFLGWSMGFPLRSRDQNTVLEVKRSQCVSMKGLMGLVEERHSGKAPALLSPPPPPSASADPLDDPELSNADFPLSVLELLTDHERARAGLERLVASQDSFLTSLQSLFDIVLEHGSVLLFPAVPLLLHFVVASVSGRDEREALMHWRAELLYCVAYTAGVYAYWWLAAPWLRFTTCVDFSDTVESVLHGGLLLLFCIQHQQDIDSDSVLSSWIWTAMMAVLCYPTLKNDARFFHLDRDVFCSVMAVLVVSASLTHGIEAVLRTLAAASNKKVSVH
jgi:hypothetical protein